MKKIYLSEAEAKGYKYFTVNHGEQCYPIEEIQDFIDDAKSDIKYDPTYLTQIEFMSPDTEHLFLNAEDIITNAIEEQEIFDEGDAVPDKAMEDFKEACKKFNEAVHKSSTTYKGSGDFLQIFN